MRVTHLAATLARRGCDTHLLFVGDPAAPGCEVGYGGCLTLHRPALRQAARDRADFFSWDHVVDVLFSKIQFVARTTGLRLIRHDVRPIRDAVQLTLDLQPAVKLAGPARIEKRAAS